MLFKALAVAVSAAGLAAAARPANESICDYYTTALLTNNTAANQLSLLTLVVNTAVIGNYSPVTVGTGVPGILAKGTYNGTAVNLLPYFDGTLASSNRGGSVGVAINFLDDGGAVPLTMNKPANTTTSAQYTLLTHLYEYFGVLLGCSLQGTGDYSAYEGQASMASVHRFMDLSYAEVGYFISQVAASAQSFGVAESDLTVVGDALVEYFDYRCSPATTIVPAQGAQFNSICQDAATCPLANNSVCSSYNATTEPSVVNSTTSSSNTTASATGATPTSSSFTGGAATIAVSFGAAAAGLFAAFL